MLFWYYCLDKKPTKLFLDFCPEIFCTFLGASLKLLGTSCKLPCLWYYILSPQEALRASMKPPGSYKKNSGQKSRNNFVGIFVQMMKPKGHFQINWPLARWEKKIQSCFHKISDFFFQWNRALSCQGAYRLWFAACIQLWRRFVYFIQNWREFRWDQRYGFSNITLVIKFLQRLVKISCTYFVNT